MKVVIAFIEQEDSLLITRRALHTHFGGFWELPGGKIEEGEHPEAALVRELKEELNIDVINAHLISRVEQAALDFYLYHVQTYHGSPMINSQQIGMQWMKVTQISEYTFPPSNALFFEIWNAYTREIPK